MISDIFNDTFWTIFDCPNLDWLALHLKVGSGIDKLFLEIIRSYVNKFNVFFIMLTILKSQVSTIVSINFFFKLVLILIVNWQDSRLSITPMFHSD